MKHSSSNFWTHRRMSKVYGIFFLLLSIIAFGQNKPKQPEELPPLQIFGKGKVKNGKILLKWSINDAVYWKNSFKSGYKVERTTVTRNGQPLMKEEKIVLKDKLVPLPLNQWESLAKEDSMVLVVAQAIYGEDFQVITPPKNINEMMMQDNENQQRFLFALMAADRSFLATKAAGWGIEDNTAVPGEKYVYTISYNGAKESVIPATTYIGLDSEKPEPIPIKPEGIFGNKAVMLIWDFKSHMETYSAYNLERSEDGINFKTINNAPIYSWESKSTLISYTDSLEANYKPYYYRIRGIDYFGELSEPSEVFKGEGIDILEYSPQIIVKNVINENEIEIGWDFPEEGEKKINEFQILKSINEAGPYEIVKDKIPPQARSQTVTTSLDLSNYFMVKAISPTGAYRSSFAAFVQPVDSIAPLPPIELKGKIDSTGVVHLSWKRNTEKDIYGYKVFRANNKNEEFAQVTSGIWENENYKDSINIGSLNHKVYYKLIALDKRYNESKFSQILEIVKPDKIPPSMPVLSNFILKEDSIQIFYVKSTSDDVVMHRLYRRSQKETLWKMISEITTDSLGTYIDAGLDPNEEYYYTLVAIDHSGNESTPADPLIASPIPKLVRPAIKNLGSFVDRKNKYVEIYWSSKEANIAEYQLYKKKVGEEYILYRIFGYQEKIRFVDEVLNPGNTYQYAVKAVFKDGTSSKIEETIVEY